MTRPTKIETGNLGTWLEEHPGWSLVDGKGLAKSFEFKDFAAALGFVVRVGLAAEKRDHHPDVTLSWGKARVHWSTHDAGGVTTLDFTLAELTDTYAQTLA